MASIQNRFFAAGERLSFQAGGHLEMGQFRYAETKALNALGIFMFLIFDVETPIKMRDEIENRIPFLRNTASRARSGWLKQHIAPKLQGKRISDPQDSELDEILGDVELTMREVASEY